MTHDFLYNICGITSFSAINLEIFAMQKNLKLASEPYDWPFFFIIGLPWPRCIEFHEVAMLVITTSNYANLASMVIVKNRICQNHTTLQLKLKKQLIYNYYIIIPWVL